MANLASTAEAGFGHKILHTIFNPIGGSVAAESIGEAMLVVSNQGPNISNGTILENRDIIVLSNAYKDGREE